MIIPWKDIFSFTLFQAVWWGLFYLGQTMPLIDWWHPLLIMSLITIGFLLFQFKFISSNPMEDLQVTFKALIMGFALDGGMLALGLIKPGEGLKQWGPDCQWMVLIGTFVFLWIVFSSIVNSSMKSLRARPRLFVSICFLFGPITYLGPEKALFIEYSDPRNLALLVHGFLWAIWALLLAKRN